MSNKTGQLQVLIALLAILGVELIVIVIVVVFGRRRWLRGQPGCFVGAIRVSDGNVDGLIPRRTRGWVRDVLVWSKAPFLFRDVLVPVDGVSGEHPASPGDVKRLGDTPVVVQFDVGGAKIEIAARRGQSVLVKGPLDRAREDRAETTRPSG